MLFTFLTPQSTYVAPDAGVPVTPANAMQIDVVLANGQSRAVSGVLSREDLLRALRAAVSVCRGNEALMRGRSWYVRPELPPSKSQRTFTVAALSFEDGVFVLIAVYRVWCRPSRFPSVVTYTDRRFAKPHPL